jgi:hypothetical protein
VTESGQAVDKAEGVTFLRKETDRVVLGVASGSYKFVSAPEPAAIGREQ